MKVFAGIGSRRASADVLGLCIRVAREMGEEGWRLRSGHAIGCDQAFEQGARGIADVFLPWHDFESATPVRGKVVSNPTFPAEQLARRLHPTGERLSVAATRLHARNCHIILGADLESPVDRVICWTLDESRGGTSMGLRIAREHGIPVHNLAITRVRTQYLALCDHQLCLRVD